MNTEHTQVSPVGLVVAIDGPSGSGKSSVSKAVANELKIGYLDTGATYRAATWYCLNQGVDLDSEQEVTKTVANMPLEISLDPQDFFVKVGDIDITAEIRSSDLSKLVSTVAANLQVREYLGDLQRRLLSAACEKTHPVTAGRGIVVEGRDITTVIAPQAPVRILLTASEEARLARRAKENFGKADSVTLESTKAEVTARDAKDQKVTSFMQAAPGVVTIDSSKLGFEEVCAQVIEICQQVCLEQATTSALLAGIEAYELEVGDAQLIWGQKDESTVEEQEEALPVLAVIGRPNVGKSTIVNRILGRRVAVVQDMPGVTRDRVRYEAEWSGRRFTLVDTGGWEVDVAGIDAAVARQAEFAIEQSDAVMFVVDATVGITDTDEQIVRLLRRAGKPVLLVANKVDSAMQEADAAMFWSLGIGEPFSLSALHGRGSGDMLDEVLKILPTHSSVAPPQVSGGPRRIALVGRPNVGKSSLLNKLAGEDRVVVNELAGTTRDPVDETLYIGDRPWVFVDTAGIRRRVHQTKGADFYASLRTQAALEKAECALVLIDASQPLTEQDIRVVQQAIDAGRAIVIAMNKWDLVDEERQSQLKRELEKDLVQIQWAPRFNVSALTGWHTNRLMKALDEALEGWDTRIPTGRLNAFIGEVVAAHPHPVRGGKQPRILFATQVSNRPPRFVLFATGFLEAPYRRFLENRLRENFGFVGSPVEISVRVREKRKRK